MSNGNASFAPSYPGGQYGPGGIIQNISSQPGQRKRISVTPGPSIAGDNTAHFLPWGAFTTTNDTIGNMLEFDSSSVNLGSRYAGTITMAVNVYFTVPAAASPVNWTISITQNSTGLVFSNMTEIQPGDSNIHYISSNAIVTLRPNQQFRILIQQASGAAIVLSECDMFIAMIGTS